MIEIIIMHAEPLETPAYMQLKNDYMWN